MIQPLMIGTTELLLIAGVALLLFGGKKLPEMMKGLGQGVKEFKKGMHEESETLQEENTQGQNNEVSVEKNSKGTSDNDGEKPK